MSGPYIETVVSRLYAEPEHGKVSHGTSFSR